MVRTIKPVAKVQGQVQLPGSKSITHRALLMAALADGRSHIVNPLAAEDTLLTARALEQLGVHLEWGKNEVRVAGPNFRWAQPPAPISLGNSGTSMRLLLAIAAAGTTRVVLDGTDRLRERPIGPVLNALKEQGTDFKYLGAQGYPPVEIIGNGLLGGKLSVDASQSSQFLSALLIVSPTARGDVAIAWKGQVASLPYVHLTMAMMEQFGIQFEQATANGVLVRAPQSYRAQSYLVEGDCSSASYFWAAAAVTGGEVSTVPVGREALQGDCRFVKILEQMGCQVAWGAEGVRVLGPSRLKAVDVDMNRMPDMVPTLAVVAAFAEGESRIHNVAHLRIKESDRLSVVAMELNKLGIRVREGADSLIIEGGQPHAGAIESHDDHRIAMAFAVAGLRVPGVEIHGAEAVAKSFPTFWEEFEKLCY